MSNESAVRGRDRRPGVIDTRLDPCEPVVADYFTEVDCFLIDNLSITLVESDVEV